MKLNPKKVFKIGSWECHKDYRLELTGNRLQYYFMTGTPGWFASTDVLILTKKQREKVLENCEVVK